MIPKAKKGRKRIHHFEHLEVNERVEVKGNKLAAIQSAYQYGRKVGKTFVARTLEDGVYIYRAS